MGSSGGGGGGKGVGVRLTQRCRDHGYEQGGWGLGISHKCSDLGIVVSAPWGLFSTYVCMYVCMHVRMHVCIDTHVLLPFCPSTYLPRLDYQSTKIAMRTILNPGP